MTVDAFLAADPSCFGSADVQVAGWEGEAGVDPAIGTVQPDWLAGGASLASLVPHLPSPACEPACETGLEVHIDPASGLAFEDDSRWVVVTGHRHDAAAATCRYAPPTDGSDLESAPPTADEVRAICDSAFVATVIVPADPPAAELATCPAGAAITVPEFNVAGSGCFRGRSFQIVGFADAMPAIDFGDEVGVSPGWLVYPGKPFAALWGLRPLDDPNVGPRCPDVDPPEAACSWAMLHVRPGSGVTFNPSRQWLLVTGHIDDPTADTCRWIWPPDWSDPKESDSQARRWCRQSFVATSIRETTAP